MVSCVRNNVYTMTKRRRKMIVRGNVREEMRLNDNLFLEKKYTLGGDWIHLVNKKRHTNTLVKWEVIKFNTSEILNRF